MALKAIVVEIFEMKKREYIYGLLSGGFQSVRTVNFGLQALNAAKTGDVEAVIVGNTAWFDIDLPKYIQQIAEGQSFRPALVWLDESKHGEFLVCPQGYKPYDIVGPAVLDETSFVLIKTLIEQRQPK